MLDMLLMLDNQEVNNHFQLDIMGVYHKLAMSRVASRQVTMVFIHFPPFWLDILHKCHLHHHTIREVHSIIEARVFNKLTTKLSIVFMLALTDTTV